MGWKFVEDDIQESQENFAQSALRQGGRALASGTAGLVGGIGDLANLASMGAEKIGLASKEGAEKFRERTLTSEKIKTGLQEEYPTLKPKNRIEKFSDDVFETVGSLISPGKSKLLTKFGLSIGANLGKEVADQISSDPDSKKGQYAKAGILFAGSLIDPKLAAREASKRYNQAKSLLPAGSKVPAVKLSNNLNSLETSILNGRPLTSISEAERSVIGNINKTKDLIKNGTIDVSQALSQRQSLYDDLKNLYVTLGKDGAKTAKNLSKKIPKYLNESIEEFAHVNPEYVKLLRSADQITETAYKSNGVKRWVEREFKHSPIAKWGLFTVGAGPSEGIKTLYKIYKSPEMRKLYAKAVGDATKKNSRAFAATADKLDKKLQEEQSNEKWEFID